jgi:hypothetical protein
MELRSLTPVFDGLAGGARNGFAGPALHASWHAKSAQCFPRPQLRRSPPPADPAAAHARTRHFIGENPQLMRIFRKSGSRCLRAPEAEVASLFSEARARCWRAVPIRALVQTPRSPARRWPSVVNHAGRPVADRSRRSSLFGRVRAGSALPSRRRRGLAERCVAWTGLALGKRRRHRTRS